MVSTAQHILLEIAGGGPDVAGSAAPFCMFPDT